MMDKETFWDCLVPAMEYYNHELSAPMAQFYYEKLGWMPVHELKERVDHHMTTAKSFPKVPHLLPEKAKKRLTEAPSDPRKHPEFMRCYEECLRRFYCHLADTLPEVDENVSYPIDLSPIVRRAVGYYTKAGLARHGAHTAQSQCRGQMHTDLMEAFEPLMATMEQPA